MKIARPRTNAPTALGVIDPTARKFVDRWHVGSDPEQFAISKDGKFAFIANEDDASASIIDLDSGQSRGKIKVSEEPEGMGVNPQNGEVYVTCEEKGEVFAIDPDQQRVIAKIETGGRPRSVAFLPDGSRAYVACENGGYVAVIDAKSHQLLSKIQLPTGSLPMGTAISKDGKELYVSTGRGNAVAIIDTQKNDVATTIPVGNRAWGIALDPSWNEALHCQRRFKRRLGCRSKIAQRIAPNQSRRRPMGHCDCERRQMSEQRRRPVKAQRRRVDTDTAIFKMHVKIQVRSFNSR